MPLSRLSVTSYVVCKCGLGCAIGLCGVLLYNVGRTPFVSLGAVLCLSYLILLAMKLLKLGVQKVEIGRTYVHYNRVHIGWKDISKVQLGKWHLRVWGMEGKDICLSRLSPIKLLVDGVEVSSDHLGEETLESLIRIIENRSAVRVGQELVNRLESGEKRFFGEHRVMTAFLGAGLLSCISAKFYAHPILFAIPMGGVIAWIVTFAWVDAKGVGISPWPGRIAFRDVREVIIKTPLLNSHLKKTCDLSPTLNEAEKLPDIRLNLSGGKKLDLWKSCCPRYLDFKILLLLMLERLRPDVEVCYILHPQQNSD